MGKIGQKYNMLTVISDTGSRTKSNKKIYLCKCDCGNYKNIAANKLNTNGTKSCGCYTSKKLNLNPGEKYGKLTVIEPLLEKDKFGNYYYRCLCDCGNYTNVIGHSLVTSKGTKSCGCSRIKYKDYSGKSYNGIVVLTEFRRVKGQTQWKCKCHCGNEFWTRIDGLKKGDTRSCGCYNNKIRSENVMNRFGFTEGTSVSLIRSNKLNANNTSGHKGIHKSKSGKWIAQITFRGHCYHLGTYADIIDAVNARKEAKSKFFAPIINKYK